MGLRGALHIFLYFLMCQAIFHVAGCLRALAQGLLHVQHLADSEPRVAHC